jgi:hypothetical protein
MAYQRAKQFAIPPDNVGESFGNGNIRTYREPVQRRPQRVSDSKSTYKDVRGAAVRKRTAADLGQRLFGAASSAGNQLHTVSPHREYTVTMVEHQLSSVGHCDPIENPVVNFGL